MSNNDKVKYKTEGRSTRTWTLPLPRRQVASAEDLLSRYTLII